MTLPDAERCYVCLKPMKLAYASLFLEDDGHRGVHVDKDCFGHAVEAGRHGILSGKGKGPRVFINFAFAEAFRPSQSDAAEKQMSMPGWLFRKK